MDKVNEELFLGFITDTKENRKRNCQCKDKSDFRVFEDVSDCYTQRVSTKFCNKCNKMQSAPRVEMGFFL